MNWWRVLPTLLWIAAAAFAVGGTDRGSPEKASPAGPGPCRAKCSAGVTQTISGIGTVRKPALLLGGPNPALP